MDSANTPGKWFLTSSASVAGGAITLSCASASSTTTCTSGSFATLTSLNAWITIESTTSSPTGYYYGPSVGSYTYGTSGTTGTFNFGANYKCAPCWGGFDSRVTPFKRSTFSQDSLASTAISSLYGNLGGTAQKLGNCASYMKTSTSGTINSYVFWPEADAVGAVMRGYWANSAWNAAENIWPISFVASSETHILGVAYSSDYYALYAISHVKLYVS
jgi:hypothetical protein